MTRKERNRARSVEQYGAAMADRIDAAHAAFDEEMRRALTAQELTASAAQRDSVCTTATQDGES